MRYVRAVATPVLLGDAAGDPRFQLQVLPQAFLAQRRALPQPSHELTLHKTLPAVQPPHIEPEHARGVSLSPETRSDP
jgi:hypothetical protein